jgi:hypothetical protein
MIDNPLPSPDPKEKPETWEKDLGLFSRGSLIDLGGAIWLPISPIVAFGIYYLPGAIIDFILL